ncbi:bifunctional SulP family inorganic anion transporter/carbonic anhydrase [Streptomyces sp. ISL-22]|uniref:bifunctional SulP family inorganic anion transporter/carbonic anhydrase n=1 Tax=unclassified Streptomyces TaxID=2593676 RepID=UPI001BEC26A1|nr:MULTISPECIES: SulP family inorganic anion transporter [unclassified Streptomyces]MBT2423468.1 bifunctional SulP family inorganic anion transporter/carbonic anhydrase [Streptomyces sp. ISL-24]MBT2432539.1 bifunctional SulP family inorganic anion transporter/carbonic anhydrase [Streptomyces sp. ISL-22]
MSACVPTRADDPSRAERTHESHSPPPTRPRRHRIASADVSASIAVFLIALPLSLGIALATGAPLQAGLVAAAVGGLVAGRLGGAPLQVSGPAAGLTVVTADVIQQYGWRATCAITVVAGVAQLGLGFLRVARGALAVSPAIVHGMLAGIGVTIAVAQLHIVLGGTPHSSVMDNVRELPAQLARLHPAALSVSALTLAALLLWPRLPGRAGRLLRKVPAALVAVAGATVTASLAGLSLPKVDLPSWRSHALAGLPEGPALGLVAAVLTITLVCSVQSLLGAVAVDKLVAARPELSARVGRSDLDRELLGQGASNIVSGALGGLPVAGVAVRTSANVQAGAVSRNSTMLHGVLVVVAALLMVPILEFIPLASLAALVMAVGIQMVSLHHIRTVTRHREVLVYAVTTLGVVFFGVLEGVALGIAMAVAVALHRLTRTRITHDEKEGVHYVHVRGQLTFLAVPRLSRVLHLVPQGVHVVVELDGSFMDHAAYESLQDWQNTHTAHGGSVELTGRRAGVRIGEPTGPVGLHLDAGTAAAESADCRCHPWTPWRNHQCEIPESVASHDAPTGAAHAPGTSDTDGPDESRGTGASPTGELDTVGGSSGADGPTGSGRRGESRSDASGGADGNRPSAHQLARGISAFQRNTAPLVRSELARLAREGQQPSQLFLTCADSRLVTSMITSSGPGDLFVVRNVGNLVPPPGQESGDDSVAAAIEYAVDVLRVRSITVCGHSGCGAMQALLNSAPGGEQTPLRRWLRHGRPSLERMSDESRPWARLAGRAPADPVEQLSLTNVVQQLEHLRAHESVARALRAGALELHGMYFHVGEAQAYLLTEGSEDKVFDHVGVADLSA